jgi:hypothetical protein
MFERIERGQQKTSVRAQWWVSGAFSFAFQGKYLYFRIYKINLLFSVDHFFFFLMDFVYFIYFLICLFVCISIVCDPKSPHYAEFNYYTHFPTINECVFTNFLEFQQIAFYLLWTQNTIEHGDLLSTIVPYVSAFASPAIVALLSEQTFPLNYHAGPIIGLGINIGTRIGMDLIFSETFSTFEDTTWLLLKKSLTSTTEAWSKFIVYYIEQRNAAEKLLATDSNTEKHVPDAVTLPTVESSTGVASTTVEI